MNQIDTVRLRGAGGNGRAMLVRGETEAAAAIIRAALSN